MATLAESLLASAERRLPIRKRADLEARRHRYLGKTYWIVKDPVGLNYFRFEEEEFAILRMLDGNISLAEIKRRFEASFPPQKITLDELQQFLGQLHRSGLVISEAPGQAIQLQKRRKERRRKQLIATLGNILAIRFKGVDPEPFLNWLYPKVRWLFSPWFLGVCVFLWVAAITLILVEFDVFTSRLPGFHQFFGPGNWLWLAATLAFMKILHELGHGLTAKHFGGECHDIGVMILVLTPCLYCNVSDSWMLPNKWHRAAIGAAGIFVEVTIAAIATFIWWFTEPSLIHYLALNAMFIGSVSTVLFNGNPLLRYDGYYVLADLVEIPNLRQKAGQFLNQKLGQWFLGLEPPEDPFMPKQRKVFFITYALAAVVYRWIILFSILMFLYQVFEPYGLKIIGQAIVAAAIYGLLFQPVYSIWRFFYVPGRWYQVKKPRMIASAVGAVLLLLFVCFVPLPYRVIAALELQPDEADTVYVSVAGILKEIYVKPGDQVSAGQPIVKLSNPDLELEIARLQSQCRRTEIALEYLTQFERYSNPTANLRTEQLEKTLEALRQQLEAKMSELPRLALCATRAGTILPPPRQPVRPSPTGQLPSWSGIPLDKENLGCFLEQGTKVCLVGDPRRFKAVLVIPQSEIEFVAVGQKVQIKLDVLPDRTFLSTLAEISAQAMEVGLERLATRTGGEVPMRIDRTGVERPVTPSYQGAVYLVDDEGILQIGLRGRAKIHVAPQSLGYRLWRWIARTFNFTL